MERLRSHDLRALGDFLARVDGVPDAATLARRVMVSLPTLVPSDLTVWTEMDPGRGRLLLNLVRAHVGAMRHTLVEVSRAKHEIAALHRGLDVLDEGVVVVASECRVLHATRQARAWFAEYFPGAASNGHLPGPV